MYCSIDRSAVHIVVNTLSWWGGDVHFQTSILLLIQVVCAYRRENLVVLWLPGYSRAASLEDGREKGVDVDCDWTRQCLSAYVGPDAFVRRRICIAVRK